MKRRPEYSGLMAIQPPRTRWPDERLDDLNELIDGFAQIERDMRPLKAEIDQRFDRIDDHFNRIDGRFEGIDGRFDKVDDRFDRVDERFDRRFDELSGQFHALQRVMLIGLIGLSGSILAALATALMKLG